MNQFKFKLKMESHLSANQISKSNRFTRSKCNPVHCEPASLRHSGNATPAVTWQPCPIACQILVSPSFQAIPVLSSTSHLSKN